MKEKTELVNAKEVVQDLADTTLEMGATTVLDNLPEIGAAAAEIIGNETIGAAVQTLTGGLLGAVAPVFLGVKLSFQQKRFERNILKLLDSVNKRQEIIEQRLCQLEPDVQQKFINGPYRDVLFDNIISENQEQKVQDNINGYINLMGVENPNDNIVFTFFHTLSQMNELDIRVLKMYGSLFDVSAKNSENYLTIMKDENIDESQYNYIGEKLCRLGMLSSRNEENRDQNLDILGKTVTELIKQLSSKNPKVIKTPRLRYISFHDSYVITRLGQQYLNFINDPQ